MPYRPISLGELRECSFKTRAPRCTTPDTRRGLLLTGVLALLAAMQILQTCPFAVAEPTAVVHEHKRWAGQTRIHSLVTTEIEHERELGRSRVLGILKGFFLELAAGVVL